MTTGIGRATKTRNSTTIATRIAIATKAGTSRSIRDATRTTTVIGIAVATSTADHHGDHDKGRH